MAQRADDQPAHQAGVAEPHLGLAGMDVDIDLARRRVHEQGHQRMAAARQQVLVGTAHGAEQQLVAHRPAVDEKELQARVAAIERRQAGIAGKPDTVARRLYGQRVVGEIAPHDRGQARQPRVQQFPLGRLEALGRAPVRGQGEGDFGMRHGKLVDHVGHGRRLGARAFHELEPRRGSEEQIARLDAGAAAKRRRRGRADPPALDRQGPRLAGAARPAGQGEPAHRADRRQRLAPKTQGADVGQVVVGQLGSDVALDRQRKLVRAHAVAVVGDRDQRSAAVRQRHVDTRRAGVDGVLDQFLDHRRRTFDHLAGGDAVDQTVGQAAQSHALAPSVLSDKYWRASVLPRSTAG